MEFIKGKWYKTIAGSFIKYSHTCSDGLFRTSENIMYGNQPHEIVDGKFGSASRIENFTEADLLEFSDLLPKGHPDKKFVLPENWHVVVTKDNLDVLSRWRFNDDRNVLSIGLIVGISYNLTNKEYSKQHNPIGDIKDSSGYYDFGQEITYEQFKKYVLKQQEEDYNYLIKVLKKWNIK